MTIIQMVDLFKLIQDKVDSIYYIDDEIVEFLNTAQRTYIESNIFNKSTDEQGGLDQYFIEVREQNTVILEPLIVRDLSFVYSQGVPLHSAIINAGLDTIVGTSGNEFLYPLSIAANLLIATPDRRRAKFVRHNDFDMFQENSLKAASPTNIQYTYASDGIKIFPDVNYEEVFISVIRRPAVMSIANNIDSELAIGSHIKIVSLALLIAGVPSNEPELAAFYAIVDS